MSKFISNNIHWILIIFVIINLITIFVSSNDSKQDIVALIFGVIALLGVSFLAFYIEIKKKI